MRVGRFLTFLSRRHNIVTTGKVKPVVDSVYPFEDALKAYERLMSKRARGKVIVEVDLAE